MATMHEYAVKRKCPLVILRLLADDANMCEAYRIKAGHHYMDQGEVSPFTDLQYAALPESLTQAVSLAILLCTRGFARADQLDEFVALVTLIQNELNA